MLKTGQNQNLSQNQTQQQRLSPQQIQYIKLLQLPTIALEQRIKEEIELNPVLEEDFPEATLNDADEFNAEQEPSEQSDEVEPVDEKEELDWDEYMKNTEYDGNEYRGSSGGGGGNEDWRDLPDPYHETLLEELENQVALLNFDKNEKIIAAQILGSLDGDGYFRRDIDAVVDNLAFNKGILISEEQVQDVRRQIQRLDPVGIASRDLQDCLQIQLQLKENSGPAYDHALRIVSDHWEAFEKKHFKKLKKRLDINDQELKEAFACIRGLDPKPGGVLNAVEDTKNYIEPDFEVTYEKRQDEEEGDFIISLNNQNVPALKISPRYKEMWEDLKKKDTNKTKETKSFIKDKMESAQWFIDSIRQRQNTLMNTMQTIVALQEAFFKFGEGLKPMILKDIAERINLDISTISRVVNGKYVQTKYGVFELKYFFSEGIETESGEQVSSREVKKKLQDIVDAEDKQNPYSDKALGEMLNEEGYKVARRTVSKYREKLNIPVARLRKEIG